MSLSLTPNTLYIAIYVRTDPPVPDNFHWALYYHHDAARGGTKYHITNEWGQSAWMASHGPESNILKTFLLVGLLRIVDIPSGAANAIDQLIRSYDGQLNDLGVTCRTWVFRVLRLLQGQEPTAISTVEDGNVLDAKVDLELLEREVMDWGKRYAEESCRNMQPRPVGDLSLN
ncbi:hypothetical protein BJX96DRAFT_178882 [Aspergillus floccosus]